ncbi:helix-turn-helix domain-containing protein [Peribacillus sp. B2I2]|uniref:helix-turn-helix domain-containing protein n=1 Tax=Peribacillus sp. B2I2 TaxID=3156468 RepID=UPI003516ADF8
MARFSSEEKIQAVRQYIDGNEGGQTIAKSIGVHPSLLHQWIKQFELFGDDAFEKRYTPYPAQFKLDVLNYMNEQGTSIRKTAAIFNIPSYETLRKWKVAYETEGFDALQSKKKGRPSMKNKNNKTSNTQVPDEGSIEALQAENERLRMENAYFKKVECLSSKQGKITKQDKAQVVYELRNAFSVKALIQLADIPRSTYYYWVKNFGRPDPDAELKVLIKSVFDEHDVVSGWKSIMKRQPGLKKAQLLLQLAKKSVGTRQALEAYKFHLEQLLEEYDFAVLQLERVEQEVKDVLKQIPFAKKLLAIKGISEISLAGILGEAGDLSGFSHGNSLLRHAGLHLAEASSGKWKGQIVISKRGRSRLRRFLYLATMSLVMNNTEFQAIHSHNVKVKKMKKMKSIMKLVGKLARIFVGIARRNESYCADKVQPITELVA